MHWSIRVRVTAIATVAVAVVLAVTAAVLLAWQQQVLSSDLDESLAAYADELISDIARGDPGATVLPARVDDDAIAQINRRDGELVATTANFADQPALPTSDASAQVRTGRLFSGDVEYRIVTRRSGDWVVHVGAPLDDIRESVSALRIGLAVTIPTVVLVIAALVWWLVGRTLEPVDAIRRQVADISSRNLDRRVPEPDTGDEIHRLALTMNAMLDRLEAAVERQQRFVADASHELRSPLTRIRTEIEVDLEHPDTADLTNTHRSVLEEATHLQQLVDDLLILARLDAEHPRHAVHRLVDLDDIVLAEAEHVRQTTDLTVHTSRVSPALVGGDSRQLTRAVRNLMDNAARYARSEVNLVLDTEDDHITLRVHDDGPGIPDEHRGRVFDRFTRVDPWRISSDGGTGLGLAIVHDIVEHHGGSIQIGTSTSPGAEFIIELPLPAEHR